MSNAFEEFTISDNIKRIRQKKGLTQAELAAKCQMKDTQLRRYELGQTVPRKKQLERIAEALEVNVSELKTRYVFKPQNINFSKLFSGANDPLIKTELRESIEKVFKENAGEIDYADWFYDWLEAWGIEFTFSEIDNGDVVVEFDKEKYQITNQQFNNMPDINFEQIKALIRGFDKMNKESKKPDPE